MINYKVIVLAAGLGKRMNAGENKQFIALKNKPLIIHTLEVFEKDEWCDSILLVINPKEKVRMEQLVSNHSFSTPLKLVDGGAQRQESVFSGLKQLDRNGIVFIHDGARPFVKKEDLHQLAEVTKQKRAALLAVPVTDTIKQQDGNRLTTLDRDKLWAAQTPQAFYKDLIYWAHQSAVAEQFLGTDDASLVERMGHNVEIVKGSYQNIKLTTPEDLLRAQSYFE